MKRALVTGSAGFIGRHLVPKLTAAGYHVTAIDPEKTVKRSRVRPVKQKLEDCLSHLKKERFDAIIHAAANIPDVDKRMKQGMEGLNDIALDMLMCRYVEDNPPKMFVVMSSCAIDYQEDPYAFVKHCLERFAEVLWYRGIPVTVLRPFSGYGTDQELTYPFPAILSRAKQKKDPLVVWGGEQIRDFVHIDDLVAGIMHAVKGKFPQQTPIELGTGVGTNFLDLAAMMAAAVGYTPTVKGDPNKAKSSLRRVANIKLARRYGWEAKITLEEGIERALRGQ